MKNKDEEEAIKWLNSKGIAIHPHSIKRAIDYLKGKEEQPSLYGLFENTDKWYSQDNYYN